MHTLMKARRIHIYKGICKLHFRFKKRVIFRRNEQKQDIKKQTDIKW